MSSYNRPHEFETAPPQQATAEVIRELNAANYYGPTPQQGQQLEYYRGNHATYINGVSQDVETAVKATDTSIAATDSTAPIIFTFARNQKDNSFNNKSQLEGKTLDTSSLGLPPVPTAIGEALGIAIEKGPQGDAKRVSALVRTEHGTVKQLQLENVSAANNPADRVGAAWVLPGNALLSRGVEVTFAKEENQKTGKGIQRVTVIPEHKGDTITFLRSTPTKAERELTRPPMQYRKRIVAGAIAGAAVMSSFIHPQTEESSPAHTAIEMVAPPNTAPGGITQATSMYDAFTGADFSQQTIDNARNAFTSYFAGDHAGLEKQAKELGYNDNWISLDKLGAVQNARNMAELEQTANQALAGSPVHVTIANTSDRINELTRSYGNDYEISRIADFGSAQHTTEDVLAVVNTFSIKNLRKQIGPLDMVIAGTITATGTISEVGTADGFTDNEGSRTRIVLAGNDVRTEGDAAMQTTIVHENTHDQDKNVGQHLSGVVESMMPPDYQLLNGDNLYDTVSSDAPITDAQGNRVVNDPYGATNPQEAVATAGQNLGGPNPTIDINKSTFQQTEVEILLSEEQQQPGFIASMLSRAKSVGVPGAWNRTKEIWNESSLPLQLVGIASLVGAAGSVRKARVNQRIRRMYSAAK